MSEQLNINHEQHEAQMNPEHLLPTEKEAAPLQPGEHLTKTNEQLAAARNEIERNAVETDPIKQLEAQEAVENAAQATSPRVLSAQLKQVTFNQEITAVRRKLTPTQR